MAEVTEVKNMASNPTNQDVKINKQIIKGIADSLAEEIAQKMYYKLLMLKYISEIKAVEGKKIKALGGKEVDRFFANLTKTK